MFIVLSNLRQTNPFSNAELAELAARMVEYFEIVKMLVTRGANFNLVMPYLARGPAAFPTVKHFRLPCLAISFLAQLTISDLSINKYLLRNGATSDFMELYHVMASSIYSLDCVSPNFLKLFLLAGCKFDKYFKKLQEETQAPPAYAERVQPLHDTIKALFSQPLTLQELSVMAIRQCIGSRQLWAKIDSLPDGIPRFVKDIIKLKTV